MQTDIMMTFTYPSFKKIDQYVNKENALYLYFFYYATAKYQHTNRPWATVSFCANGLDWGVNRVREAKKTLIDCGLIKEVHASGKLGKAYIQILFASSGDMFCEIEEESKDLCTTQNREGKENTEILCTTGFVEGNKTDRQMLSTRKENAYDKNSFKLAKANLHDLSDRCEDDTKSLVYNGLLCPVCKERQFQTRSGDVCKNGHGGELGIEPVKKKLNGKKPILAKLQSIGKIVKTPNPLNYSPDVLKIISYWRQCGGKVHTKTSAVKGVNQIENFIAELLMDGRNPYNQVINPNSDLRMKKWTISEIKESIRNYTQVKYKPIDKMYFPQFVVFMHPSKSIPNYSPLVDNHIHKYDNGVVEWAELLKKTFADKFPDIHMHQKVLLDVAVFLFDAGKKYQVSLNSELTFGQSIPKVFIAYVIKHLNAKGIDQLKYISGHAFLSTFLTHAVKRDHNLITKNQAKRIRQSIDESRQREMDAEKNRNEQEFTDSDF